MTPQRTGTQQVAQPMITPRKHAYRSHTVATENGGGHARGPCPAEATEWPANGERCEKSICSWHSRASDFRGFSRACEGFIEIVRVKRKAKAVSPGGGGGKHNVANRWQLTHQRGPERP